MHVDRLKRLIQKLKEQVKADKEQNELTKKMTLAQEKKLRIENNTGKMHKLKTMLTVTQRMDSKRKKSISPIKKNASFFNFMNRTNQNVTNVTQSKFLSLSSYDHKVRTLNIPIFSKLQKWAQKAILSLFKPVWATFGSNLISDLY
jgi:hypothetical protein